MIIALDTKSGQLPTEFRIWPFGKIKTSKGTFLFDATAAKSVMNAFHDAGNILPIDWLHNSLKASQSSEDGKAAGWFKLQLRDDGLYAVDVKWGPAAAKALADKEYRYFSPAFTTTKGNRIERMINMALTNLPATHGLTPLVAAAQNPKDCMADSDSRDFKSKAEEMAYLKQRMAELEAEEEKDPVTNEDDMDSDDSDDSDSPETNADEHDEPDGDEGDVPPPKKTSKPAKMSDLQRTIVQLTGQTDTQAQVGALIALSESNKRLAAMERRVAKIDAREHARKVERAIQDGRLTPGQRGWALSVSTKVLDGYIKTAPKGRVPMRSSDAHQEPAASGVVNGNVVKLGDGSSFALSHDELEIAEKTGQDLVRFAEGLKALRKGA